MITAAIILGYFTAMIFTARWGYRIYQDGQTHPDDKKDWLYTIAPVLTLGVFWPLTWAGFILIKLVVSGNRPK